MTANRHCPRDCLELLHHRTTCDVEWVRRRGKTRHAEIYRPCSQTSDLVKAHSARVTCILVPDCDSQTHSCAIVRWSWQLECNWTAFGCTGDDWRPSRLRARQPPGERGELVAQPHELAYRSAK